MSGMGTMGRFLIVTGAIFIVLGMVFVFGGKLLPLGRLPGDIFIRRENFSFSFPIVTCILLSVILTIILNLFFRR